MPHHHVPGEQQPQPSAESAELAFRARPRPRTHHYQTPPPIQQEPELARPRPRSFYEVPLAARELRGPRNPVDAREVSINDVVYGVFLFGDAEIWWW